MCLVPEIRDIISSGQMQLRYKSGVAERKLRVDQKHEMRKLRKRCHVCCHMGLRQAWSLTLNVIRHHWMKIE